jgi:type VI secretion system protein ImpG
VRDELLGYYERELSFLRQMGADFAQKYPKIAARLLLEADKCEDPHVERMIEAFAFLAGRIHLKIDDEFPEVTESLLNVLYPHYLAPVPSMSVVQFALDPTQGKLTTGYEIPRETTLYSRAVAGTPCRFRTSYPVTVWPMEVAEASLVSLDPVDTRGKWSEALLKITVQCLNNTKLSELKTGESDVTKARPVESLRFFLNGEPQVVYPLYEMIFNHATRVEMRDASGAGTRARPTAKRAATGTTLTLPTSVIGAVGFDSDEGMLPFPARSFAGYRLLTEYFTFPDKFMFFDIAGLDEAARRGFGDRFEISIYLRDVTPLRAVVDSNTFALACAPVINLFNKIAEPIQLTAQQHEYHVIPDVHRQMATEIYSIESVRTTDPQFQQSREFQPFYSYRHIAGGNGAGAKDNDRAFWYATRRPSARAEDPGTEIFISLVDLGFNPHVPAVETITINTICTNRDLPGKLPFGGRETDFEIEGTAPLSRIQCLKKPTPTVRPPMRRAAHWRLISHLSLNHLSLIGNKADGTPESLQEILLLYDFLNSAATRKQITGITRVDARRVVRQTGSRIGAGFVRGLETTVEFNEENYVGSGMFLFAAVLERFLGLYASINSFNQLVATSQQREGIIKRWPPRAGEQTLL